MVHMRTVSSLANPDRVSGMGLQVAYHAAVDGKRPVNKASRLTKTFACSRRLVFAAAAFFAASTASGYAQSGGPFAGMAGVWAGGGTVTLDDGSRERLRCRGNYAVAGNTLTINLTCASDAYRFDLRAGLVSEGGAISGTWSETSRNVGGNLAGRGAAGNLQFVASAAGFNANISLRTAGNRQSVAIRADSIFRGADISLSK
jgi:hypothetical protein